MEDRNCPYYNSEKYHNCEIPRRPEKPDIPLSGGDHFVPCNSSNHRTCPVWKEIQQELADISG